MRDSRSRILENIRINKPAQDGDLPSIPDFRREATDDIFDFGAVAASSGSRVIHIENIGEVQVLINDLFPSHGQIASCIPEVNTDVDLSGEIIPRKLKDVDVAIIPADLGVAENGAVWISTQSGIPRLLPFVCQHLMVVLEKKNIVQNMHLAYQKLDLKASGFGVFIAGPSKTADIEQSLVIGAQGARSHTVVLV